MKNAVVVNITEQVMIIVIIVDMGVNWIVKVLKGSGGYMSENKRYVRILDHSEKEVRIFDEHNQKNIFNIFFMGLDSAICLKGALEDTVDLLNELSEEIEQLKNKIGVLEDDNETYHKSLEKLNLYTKRFIPTKCTNEFKDCKTNRYYWLDHEGNFEGCLELLNLLDCENEVLKSENRHLKGRVMEYEEQIKGDD